MRFYYIPHEAILVLHDSIIETRGGCPGIIDSQQIESIFQFVQNDDYYPTIESKATHLLFSITKFHCFTDGNKRTAISATMIFLLINNYKIPEFLVDFEDTVVRVAEGIIGKDELEKIIKEYIEK